jgi:hypothetical protein
VSATEEPRRPPAGSGTEEEGDELQRLSTQELHDRAVSWAERHLDVRFFWRLLKAIPLAEEVSGDEGEAEYDLHSAKGLITDAMKSGEGELGEALRPLFIDYLRNHPGALR